MTVTDEDKALFVALMGYDSETIDAILGGNAFTWEVEQIAKYRQAAYAAGLERAAVIMEGEAKTLYRIAHMNLPAYSPTVARDRAQYCEGMADAIRAEKDKT